MLAALRRDWRRRGAILLHVLAAVAGFLVVTQHAVLEYKGPAAHGWWANTTLQLVGVMLVGIVVLGDGLAGAFRKVFEPKRERLSKEYRDALLSALVAVSKCIQEVDLLELGLSLFVVGKDGFRGEEVLNRKERFRLSNYPHPSKVRFTAGKGIVGKCWADKRPTYIDWQPVARKWGGRDISDDEFAKIREETRAGFSRSDFVALVDKYAEIHAVPVVREDGQFVGVLALDREIRDPIDEMKLLQSKDVVRILTEAAKSLGSVLAPA